MSFLPLAFNMPIVFFPAHIAFLELVIDPACSLVFEAEPEEKNIMSRPPRNLKTPLFNRRAALISFFQGAAALAASFGVLVLALKMGLSEEAARTLTFATIIFTNLMLIVSNLSWTRNFFQILCNGNKMLYWVAGGTLLTLFFVLAVPDLREIFHFAPIGWQGILFAFLAAALSILWFELAKTSKILFKK
jgi:Ca2+-transporting ATPase